MGNASMAGLYSNKYRQISALILVSAFVLGGCDANEAAKPGAGQPLPSVVTVPIHSKDVSAALEFVGQSEASQRVDIRARVQGVLLERAFEEGGDVKNGAILFKIDPAEFVAAKAAAEADVARAAATVEEASRSLARYEELVQRDTASVAQYDSAKAKDGQARADLAAAKAALQKAELDLGYTTIHSPIDGRTGRAKVDTGNLIGPDTGVLATVVNLDPIHVIFSVSERDYLNYQQAVLKGNAEKFTPRIRLATGNLYGHDGEFDLIENEVDPATGSITLRLKFPNPDGLIVPGQFVNVVLTSQTPSKELVVPQAAVQENQTGPFVLVVKQDNRVEARPIKTGQRVGTEIVALEGLTAGESIIVEGIQKVRPGAEVSPNVRASSKKPE